MTTMVVVSLVEPDSPHDVLIDLVVGVFLDLDGGQVSREGVGLVGVSHTDTWCVVHRQGPGDAPLTVPVRGGAVGVRGVDAVVRGLQRPEVPVVGCQCGHAETEV